MVNDNGLKSDGNEIFDASLFIGDLNKDVVEQDLINSFSLYGEVVNAIIKRSRTTHIPLGYGFVTMKSPEVAQICVQQCQNMMIKGRKVRIGKAQRNSTLCISNIDPSITKATLLELFGGFGDVVAEESMLLSGGLPL